MNACSLNALEFSKVLDILASFCVSDVASGRAHALLPLDSLEAVAHSQVLYDAVVTWRAASGFVITPFQDLSGVFALLAGGRSTLDVDALWAVREALFLVRDLTRSVLESAQLVPVLVAFVGATPLPEMSLAALMRCLGDDGLLRDESSPELLRVRASLRQLHQTCLRHVKELVAQYTMAHVLQDEYMTLASDRYVLPLKANFKGRLQGIIHDYSNTGETCYFEPMFLVEHNNRLQELKREERAAEHKVMLMLTDMLMREDDLLKAAWERLVDTDLLLAKVAFGARLDAVSVTVVQAGNPLSLLQARHPLLVCDAGLAKKGGPHPVDLTLRMDDAALIISGGNAGGKTVCLKTLGLLVIMALSGLPVPVAPGSVMPWWSRVHAFIGDSQSLEDHVSTFTGQIQHLSAVWDTADAQTLVLLDEFGAGTDPAQGAALSQAVLDVLLESGATVVAATHFPALKAYALSREHVRAASMLFDPSTRQPLFALAYDQVGASQALDVAREHGMPDAVLERAANYLLLDGQDMSVVMERLNSLAVTREAEVAALRAEQAQAHEKRRTLQERFERERMRLHDEVKSLMQTLTADVKAGKIAHKEALKHLALARTSLVVQQEDATKGAAPELDALRVGQRVWHRPWRKYALVHELDARQDRVKLDMNGVFLWVERGALGLSEDGDATDNGAAKGAFARNAAGKGTGAQGGMGTPVRFVRTRSSEESFALRLDLRGKRADVALGELSVFLDKALLSSFDGVEVIHGRGTGVLRKEVHAFLKTFPGISAFVLAPEDQGGDGVTLVSFA